MQTAADSVPAQPWPAGLGAPAVLLVLGGLLCLLLGLVGWSTFRVWQADRHTAGVPLSQIDRLVLRDADGQPAIVLETNMAPLLAELGQREPFVSGRVTPDCRLDFYRQQERLDTWLLVWEPGSARFYVRPAWGLAAQDYRRRLPVVPGGMRVLARELQARLVSAWGPAGVTAFFRACRK